MDNELIDLLRTVAGGFRARMQARIASSGSGLTIFQARLINAIGRNPGISQLVLASAMDRDKAQIARTVKELEARGLVVRHAHASDWRTKCVALTEEGQGLHIRLQDIRRQLAAEILGGFPDGEKQALRAGLEKMDAALRELLHD